MHRLIIGGLLLGAVLISPPLKTIETKAETNLVVQDIPVVIHYEDMTFDHLPPAWQKLAMCESSGREQFHVALHIYADRGSKPWPYCGKFLKAEYGK